MNVIATNAAGSTTRIVVITTLTLLGLAALWFTVRSALPYLQMAESHFGPYFWPRRWGLVFHVAGGILALTVGLIQLWLGLTNRTGRLHRVLGRTYVGAIAVASIGGFYLALTINYNMPYAAGLFFLNIAWVVTTSMALFAIYQRALFQHREWMMRSYAVTFAFVTFRFGVDALIGQGLQPSDAQAIMAWACWALPLLLLEPLLQLRRIRGLS